MSPLGVPPLAEVLTLQYQGDDGNEFIPGHTSLQLSASYRILRWVAVKIAVNHPKTSNRRPEGRRKPNDTKAGGPGFEPGPADSKSAVLPLDEPPKWMGSIIEHVEPPRRIL